MAWNAAKPSDDGLLINAPAEIRANWAALALMTDADLLIDNAKVKAAAGIKDTKLAQIVTASKVSATAITGLASTPAGAGILPIANMPTATVAKGGTNIGSYSKGDLIIASALNVLSKLGIGSALQQMRVSTAGLPEWFTVSTSAYDSGWFTGVAGTIYSKTHGLGTTNILSKLYGATSAAGANMGEILVAAGEGNNGSIHQITTTTCKCQTNVNDRIMVNTVRTTPTYFRITMISLD